MEEAGGYEAMVEGLSEKNMALIAEQQVTPL
jgi:hypothetical protein